MLDKWKTLTGVPAGEIADRLEVPFDDPAAYKKITGGTAGAAGLTDIETAWMVMRLNEVFGPYGLGWWLDWDVEDVIISDDPKRPSVAVKRAEFTYLLLDEEGNERVCIAPCTGGSQNELPFALKGMETSAIGNAVSKMRFQEKVYMGKLTHANAKTFLKGRENGRSACSDHTGDFVVPHGKNKGKKLSELEPKVIEWYANEMRATNDASKELQAMAQAYQEELAPAAD
jgi:hypothetical protein